MNETYLYPYSAQEARTRNQLPMWRESYHANVACRNAIEETIRQNFDGILEPGAPDFARKLLMLQRKPRARYRINHISWWAQEMPSEKEYAEAQRNMAKVDWAVDYVITHCAPTSIALMENRHNEADPLTDFLQEVKERAHYHYWLFGHYHDNRAIDEKHILLWEQIVQVI